MAAICVGRTPRATEPHGPTPVPPPDRRRDSSGFARTGPVIPKLSTSPQSGGRRKPRSVNDLGTLLHNDEGRANQARRVRSTARRCDVSGAPRSLLRWSSTASCLLSWLEQALSAGLDRAPILPKIPAAPARLHVAPPIPAAALSALLTRTRREYEAATRSPPFSWAEFEARARLRLTRRPRVDSPRPNVSNRLDVPPGSLGTGRSGPPPP